MIVKDYKIFNDPVYGFIKVPEGILLDLVDHPFLQRMRRIKQLGLTDYVYPGAGHSRFHHALGAFHLMTLALDTLKSKGVDISQEEYLATQIAILLHDIGHGPFSHALEHLIVPIDHESISLMFMKELNIEFRGALDMAISIFKNVYEKKFFFQLVSGQLDVDRMDYLNRDCFFTGVAEGNISHDRILAMLHVVDDQLVVEEKGIYSIENFLIARHLMYWQVYLHKTVIASEQMLIRYWKRLKELDNLGLEISVTESIRDILVSKNTDSQLLHSFSRIDDMDIIYSLKSTTHHKDEELSYLAKGLVYRKLFKVKMQTHPFNSDEMDIIRQNIWKSQRMNQTLIDRLVFTGKESSEIYSDIAQEIKILKKNGDVSFLSSFLDISVQNRLITKYFLCYPPLIC